MYVVVVAGAKLDLFFSLSVLRLFVLSIHGKRLLNDRCVLVFLGLVDRAVVLRLLGRRAHPVVLVVVSESLFLHHICKLLAQIRIIWPLFKLQVATICDILVEFRGQATAESIYGRLHFFFHDFLIFVLLVIHFQILPGQLPLQEIDQHIPQAFNIISSRLLNSDVSIDRGVPCCARQTFVFFIGDVLAIFL